MDENNHSEKKPWIPVSHPWRWRFIIGVLMFSMAFVGVVLTIIKQQGAWAYWRFLSCFFALLSLALSAHLKKYTWRDSLVTVWHEIFHWLGLILAIGLLSNMVNLGILSPFAASLQVITLISLATFLAGVYIERSFLFIGGLMGAFALLLSYISIYSYLFAIPLALIFLVGFYLFIRNKSHKVTLENKK
jgi:hypothetical protein